MRTLLKEKSSLLIREQKTEKHRRLGVALKIIESNATEFDNLCQISIETSSNGTNGFLRRLENNSSDTDVEILIALIYGFIAELNISFRGELSDELTDFIKFTDQEASTYDSAAKNLIDSAQRTLPAAILKKILNSDSFANLRNVPAVSSQVEERIKKWEEYLNQSEIKATRLGNIFSEHSQAFNFVGLHDGFKDLAAEVRKELRFAQIGMVVFGILILGPALMNMTLILTGQVNLSTTEIQSLVASGIISVTLTLLLLYYFKIALRKADSCRAQLLQLGLRMSLCRFIQSYADYSNEIKRNNATALDKFESLIFSGLVESGDRLPTTFDGIDQLTNMIKSMKSNS